MRSSAESWARQELFCNLDACKVSFWSCTAGSRLVVGMMSITLVAVMVSLAVLTCPWKQQPGFEMR